MEKSACVVWVGEAREWKISLWSDVVIWRSFRTIGVLSLHMRDISCERHCNLSKVQTEVIPAILESTQQGLLIGRGGYKPRDICVSAPTGSGKTLAFVIPVIQVSCPPSLLSTFEQGMHTICIGTTACVCVKREHVERLDEKKMFFTIRCWWRGWCVKSGLWLCCPPKSSPSRSECLKTVWIT